MPVVSDAVEEVVNGEIIIASSATWNQALIVGNTYDQIRPQVEKGKALVINAKFGLIIRREPLTVRQPELSIFLRESIIEKDGYIHSAPQFVVEVLSPSDARFWQSRRSRSLDLLTRGPHRRSSPSRKWPLSPPRHLRRSVLTPLHFPNVQVRISEIWPDS